MSENAKRSSVTINRFVANEVRKAAVEATTRAGVIIKQSDLINYLIHHHLKDAIEGIVREERGSACCKMQQESTIKHSGSPAARLKAKSKPA